MRRIIEKRSFPQKMLFVGKRYRGVLIGASSVHRSEYAQNLSSSFSSMRRRSVEPRLRLSMLEPRWRDRTRRVVGRIPISVQGSSWIGFVRKVILSFVSAQLVPSLQHWSRRAMLMHASSCLEATKRLVVKRRPICQPPSETVRGKHSKFLPACFYALPPSIGAVCRVVPALLPGRLAILFPMPDKSVAD